MEVARDVFGPPVTGLSAQVSLDMSQPQSSGSAAIVWGGVALTTLALEWMAGASGTDQLVVYQNSADASTPRGAATLTVALAEDLWAVGGDNCDPERDNTPDSELRSGLIARSGGAVLAGSIGLNADATAAVLAALQGQFLEMGIRDVVTSGCSVGGKLALRECAW